MTDADQVLREVLEKIAAEHGYSTRDVDPQPFSTDGANYTSQLYRITLKEPNKDDLFLFAKVASVSEHVREITPFKIFETEMFFYTELLQRFIELEQKFNVPKKHRLATVKFYGSNDEYMKEILVLEDLSAQGYETHDRFKTFDWKYAAKSVTELAKFHALSIAYDKSNPDDFAVLAENFCFLKGKEESLKLMMEGIVKTAMGIVNEENRGRLQAFLEKNQEREFDYYLKPHKRAVLAHGDFRASNLMHRLREDGELEVVVVDYQMLKVSNPIMDLMYFIFSGTDEDFHDKYYHKLLNHYYTELCAAMRRLNVDPEITYPKDDYESDLKELQAYGVFVGMMMVPMVTVDPEDAPSMDIEDIKDFKIKINDVSIRRMNGVFNTFIKLGLL
ncbi:uncharacterized protein [Battus philenor]|uniref:uncharacterized protein n=1 Tax=Battus philenor TaxID=42288 RepID=UPI0035CF5829